MVIICCCQYKERNSPLKEADVVNAEMKMPRRGRDDGGREGAGASHFLRFLLGDRRKVYFLRSAKIGHLSFHHDNLKFPPCHASYSCDAVLAVPTGGGRRRGLFILKVCKSCMLARHCNATCQKNHWSTHKQV